MSVFRFRASQTHNGQSLKQIEKKASTALVANTFVSYDAAGRVTPATAASTSIVGIIQEGVATTDANYATTDKVVVDIPREGDEFIVDIDTVTGVIQGSEVTLTGAGTAKAVVGVGEVATLVVTEVFAADVKVAVMVKTPSLKI